MYPQEIVTVTVFFKEEAKAVFNIAKNFTLLKVQHAVVTLSSAAETIEVLFSQSSKFITRPNQGFC